jgi:hypothetical protein
MAATVQVQIATSTGPTLANAESGIKFNREDSQSGSTTPIPVPTATGTEYSYKKTLALVVTGTDSTTISNRKILLGSSPATGLKIWTRGTASDTYSQAVGNDSPSGSNGAAPASHSQEVTTSAFTYDSASVSAGSSGRNGKYVEVVLGVANNYAGGAGTAIALPDIKIQYDEA